MICWVPDAVAFWQSVTVVPPPVTDVMVVTRSGSLRAVVPPGTALAETVSPETDHAFASGGEPGSVVVWASAGVTRFETLVTMGLPEVVVPWKPNWMRTGYEVLCDG